jgi:hypothetical protein
MKKVLFALLAIIFLLPSCYPDVSSHTQGTDTTLGIQLANLDMGTFNITNVGLVDGVDVSGLAGAHTQNTDTILTTNGVTPLISAGVVVNDIKTDRWMSNDSNTFFGVDVAGSDDLDDSGGGSEATGNTAYGNNALRDITTGYQNVVVGNDALVANTTGYYNTVVGSTAAQTSTVASFNTAIGYQALANGTGGYNTAIGNGALGNPGTGTYNTAVGLQTLNSATGSRNTAIGRWAGQFNTGSDNVFLGNEAGENSGAESDVLYIDNTHDTTPLIYGDFSTDDLTINGDLNVTGIYSQGGTAGVTGVYTFYTGGASGTVKTMTINGGIITGVTLEP